MVDPQTLREMVERVEWMSPIQYEMRGFFESHDICSPRDLAENIEYDRGYTGKECRSLKRAGILDSKNQLYRLTDRGRASLAGDFNPDDLDDPT